MLFRSSSSETKKHKKKRKKKVKAEEEATIKLPSMDDLAASRAKPSFLVAPEGPAEVKEIGVEVKQTTTPGYSVPSVDPPLISDKDKQDGEEYSKRAQDQRATFRKRENKKRLIGQSSRGSNFVENEKRALRQSSGTEHLGPGIG